MINLHNGKRKERTKKELKGKKKTELYSTTWTVLIVTTTY